MFTGLSAFPLTPFVDDRLDLTAFASLVERLCAAGVDSIGAIGSTGSYAYLTREERREIARTALRVAGEVPVLVGVGAVATRDVLINTRDAQEAGAAGVLLAPLSYQPLSADEVFGLYERVADESEMPVVVYDNPATTGFTFSEDLHARIAALPGVVSIKLPHLADDPEDARTQVTRLRSRITEHVTLGISGDAAGAHGLLAGCDVWYSVLAGVFPRICAEITRAARSGDPGLAMSLSNKLDPIWQLFIRFGSYRVVSAIADETGIVSPESLHHPVAPLAGENRGSVIAALEQIDEQA